MPGTHELAAALVSAALTLLWVACKLACANSNDSDSYDGQRR